MSDEKERGRTTEMKERERERNTKLDGGGTEEKQRVVDR